VKIRLLVVDDHEATRASLIKLLVKSPEIEIVADVSLAEDAIQACRNLDPDVVLVDVSLPGDIDGVELIRRLRTAGNDVGIVGFSAYPADEMKDRLLAAGADDYLDKMAPVHELIHAIKKSASASGGRRT
jgi:two-component system invasion response regulator UvrY